MALTSSERSSWAVKVDLAVLNTLKWEIKTSFIQSNKSENASSLTHLSNPCISSRKKYANFFLLQVATEALNAPFLTILLIIPASIFMQLVNATRGTKLANSLINL